jgi:TolB-like protein/tetratricopeptide (TPR) repeat protein
MKRGGFFHEMRRRRVWPVAGAYVVVGWVLVEIILQTFPMLGLPEWIPRAAVIAGYVGFPVVLILAWLFDITPQGVVVTPSFRAAEPLEGEEPGRVVVQARPALLAGMFGAGMVVALVGFGAYSALHPVELVRGETIEAVAVLPFTDLSEEQDRQHIGEGIAEELISRLGRLGELRVAARTSSFELREAGASLTEMGRKLNVEAVVDGTIRREGDRLRVTVELVDVASGFQIWAHRYDRTVDDIFAIQDEISDAIAGALRLHLMPEGSRLGAGTDNLRAHDAYLLGLARWHGRTEADLFRARDYFQRAVDEDEGYALAHAGLALTYAVLPLYTDFPAERAVEEGYAAAARALALNAHLAEAHAAIGQIAQNLEWDLATAEVAYRRALELQPSYATGHQWYAEALVMLGRLAEARFEVGRALELDPLSLAARYIQAHLLAVERDLEGSRETFVQLLAQNPEFGFGHAGLLFVCLAADCAVDAEEAARAAFETPVQEVVLQVVRARWEPALRPAALQALGSLEGRISDIQMALFRAALEDRAGAVDTLVRIHARASDPHLPLFLVHPLFDGIRGEAPVRAITQAIGVETPAARLTASYARDTAA